MTQNKVIAIFLGPPGSGKGTQAKKLAAEINIPHIATGDLLRVHKREGTDLGKQVQKFMDAGKFAPSQLVTDMLLERIREKDCEKGFILDGYPRTLDQAEALEKELSHEKVDVLCLDVPDDVIVERMSGRLSCPSCGAVYHSKYSPPKSEGICDTCGKELIRRIDDSSEVVIERLKVYREQTAPLIAYYEKRGLLHHFDGSLAPNDVFNELLSYFSR